MRYVLAYFSVLFAFLALDASWLVAAGGKIFKSQLGPLLRDQPDLKVAAAFYLIYAAGMLVLATYQGLRSLVASRGPGRISSGEPAAKAQVRAALDANRH